MLLERKERKLTQDLGHQGQQSQRNTPTAIDLLYQRAFENRIIQKIEKSARRQQNQCQICGGRDSAPRRKSVEVSLLNDSMVRLKMHPKAHESERKIEGTSGGKRQSSKFKLKILPSPEGLAQTSRRKSWDSDPGNTVMSFQCLTHSAMRESADDDYLASEASSSDRSIFPVGTQRIRATSVSELKSDRGTRFHNEEGMACCHVKSSSNSLDTRIGKKATLPCQFKLDYRQQDLGSDESMESNESEEAKSQATKRSPSIHSQDHKVEKQQEFHQPSNFRLHNEAPSLQKVRETQEHRQLKLCKQKERKKENAS